MISLTFFRHNTFNKNKQIKYESFIPLLDSKSPSVLLYGASRHICIQTKLFKGRISILRHLLSKIFITFEKA